MAAKPPFEVVVKAAVHTDYVYFDCTSFLEGGHGYLREGEVGDDGWAASFGFEVLDVHLKEVLDGHSLGEVLLS